MKYLDFIEDHLHPGPINQFDKIRVLAHRAKDLYAGKNCLIGGMRKRKPTAQAQVEFNHGLITPKIEEVDPETLRQTYLDEDSDD